MSGTENLAASHEILAQKIENDVEGPLRRFNTSNREMQAVTSSQGNLSSIAKGLESAQKKAAKGGRKAEEATSSVDEASRSWESQAPYIFEQLQALDERRVNHLRDVLTQFQTHEVDQVERTRASAESCLNALLNIETADEIKTFAALATTGRERDSLMRRRSSAAGSARPPSSSTQIPPTPPPPRLSQRDQGIPSYPSQDRLAAPEQTPHKSKLGGLKRLGTVMNRRKSAAPPPPPPSEKKEKKTRPFSAFRRGDSSRSFQDLETTGQDLTPTISEEPRTELTQIQSTVTETQASFTPPARSPQPVEPTSMEPMVNGISQPLQPVPAPSAVSHMNEPARFRQDPMAVLQPSPVQPLPPPPQEMPTQSSPIMQHGAFTSAESEEASRNMFAIRDKPIAEDESEAQQAMSNMANQLRMQAQTSGLNRVQGSVRGRRDVRNTMFFPSGVDTSVAGAAAGGAAVGAAGGAAAVSFSLGQTPSATDLASPIAKPLPRAIHEDHALGSDTTSVHSSHSLTNQPHHPDLHDPGLNASVVETVNTWFTESGVSKSFVTGEIALAYNTTANSTAAESDTETIRLQHFELLEKVAANPMFITSLPKTAETTEESAGTYTVSLASIKRSTPVVGLKYQLHIDESSLAQYSPLLITPAWQLVEGQASIIVLYSLNPTFAAAASSSVSAPVTLKNVVISVSLDPTGAAPQSAMMAPQSGASFRRKAGSVIWRLSELTMKAEQERLLVRFMVPGGIPKKGTIEVRFELVGRVGSDVGVERRVVKEKEVDPFADEGSGDVGRGAAGAGEGWEEVKVRKCLVSGRYTAS